MVLDEEVQIVIEQIDIPQTEQFDRPPPPASPRSTPGTIVFILRHVRPICEDLEVELVSHCVNLPR